MSSRYLRLLILTSLVLLSYPLLINAEQYKCTRVADGDTITVVSNGSKLRIRLVGIDAPELSKKRHLPAQPFSQKSKEWNRGQPLTFDIKPSKQEVFLLWPEQ